MLRIQQDVFPGKECLIWRGREGLRRSLVACTVLLEGMG